MKQTTKIKWPNTNWPRRKNVNKNAITAEMPNGNRKQHLNSISHTTHIQFECYSKKSFCVFVFLQFVKNLECRSHNERRQQLIGNLNWVGVLKFSTTQ